MLEPRRGSESCLLYRVIEPASHQVWPVKAWLPALAPALRTAGPASGFKITENRDHLNIFITACSRNMSRVSREGDDDMHVAALSS